MSNLSFCLNCAALFDFNGQSECPICKAGPRSIQDAFDYCLKCKAKFNSKNMFCTQCGEIHELHKKKNDLQPKKCNYCESKIHYGTSFCGSCGNEVNFNELKNFSHTGVSVPKEMPLNLLNSEQSTNHVQSGLSKGGTWAILILVGFMFLFIFIASTNSSGTNSNIEQVSISQNANLSAIEQAIINVNPGSYFERNQEWISDGRGNPDDVISGGSTLIFYYSSIEGHDANLNGLTEIGQKVSSQGFRSYTCRNLEIYYWQGMASVLQPIFSTYC